MVGTSLDWSVCPCSRIQEVVSHCKKLTKKNKEQLSDLMILDKQKGLKSLSREKRQKLEAYQHLFYLLQVSRTRRGGEALVGGSAVVEHLPCTHNTGVGWGSGGEKKKQFKKPRSLHHLLSLRPSLYPSPCPGSCRPQGQSLPLPICMDYFQRPGKAIFSPCQENLCNWSDR